MNIHINTPCTENWSAMKNLGNERYCESCKHHVMDLRNTDQERILELYQLNGGKMCGRISGKLLAEQQTQALLKKEYLKRLKTFSWAVFICFGTTLFTMPSAKATNLWSKMKERIHLVVQDSASHIKEIKGVVRDKDNAELLPFVNVAAFVNDTQVVATATTDFDGKFVLKIDTRECMKVSVRAYYPGYETKEILDVKLDGSKPVSLEMKVEAVELMGLMIIEPIVPMMDPFQSGKTVKREDYKHMPK